MDNVKRFVRYWLPVIIYAVLIFKASSSTSPPIPWLFPHSDKVFHFIEYTLFGFLMLRALYSSKENLSRNNLRVLAVILVIIYAITDEIHQYFVPGRHMEMLDLLSDSAGACFGQFLFKIKA